jgi:hypothetical protein
VLNNTGLAIGTHTATVTVSGDAGITASFDVSFTVNPTAETPVYSIGLSQTGTYIFPAENVGFDGWPILSVTITNTGNQATGALTTVLSGANSGSFTSETYISSIAVGGTSSFGMHPNTGLAAGTYTATVTVSGDNGITASFGVSFTVNAPTTYTVTYNVNGGSGTAPGSQTVNSGTSIILPGKGSMGNGGGYKIYFAGWNTNAGGTGTSYEAGDTLTVNNTIALYAQWSSAVTITYDANGANGTPPATQTFDSVGVTLSGQGGLTYPGKTFIGWSFQPVGGFIMTGFIGAIAGDSDHYTFYAQWVDYSISLNQTGTYTFPAAIVGYEAQTAKGITITNTGDQVTGALTAALSGANSGSFTLLKTTITSIAVGGTDTFTVRPNTGLAPGTYTATVTINDSITANFNVSFTVNPFTYSINLDTTETHTFPARPAGYGTQATKSVTITNTGNQATGALSIALSGTNGGAFTLSTTATSSFSTGFSRTFTVSPNTGLAVGTYTAVVTVSGGNGITANFNVSFTVTIPTGILTVTFDSNGTTSSSAPSAQTGTYGTNITLPGQGSMIKRGQWGNTADGHNAGDYFYYTFVGWDTTKNGGPPVNTAEAWNAYYAGVYKAGTSYTIGSNITLYAVWKYPD